MCKDIYAPGAASLLLHRTLDCDRCGNERVSADFKLNMGSIIARGHGHAGGSARILAHNSCWRGCVSFVLRTQNALLLTPRSTCRERGRFAHQPENVLYRCTSRSKGTVCEFTEILALRGLLFYRRLISTVRNSCSPMSYCLAGWIAKI